MTPQRSPFHPSKTATRSTKQRHNDTPSPPTQRKHIPFSLCLSVAFSFFMIALSWHNSQAYASSVTIGNAQCWPIQKAQKSGRIRVTWGSHCAGGRSCTKSIDVEFQHDGKWHSEKIEYSTYPRRDAGLSFKIFGCWKAKKQYFSYTFKRWGKRRFHIAFSPTPKGYKMRLYITRKKPLDTKGWLRGLRCKISYRATEFRRCPKTLP